MPKITRFVLLGVAATLLNGGHASAQGTDSKPSAYAAFVTAMTAFVVANQEAIQNERNAARLAFVRQQVVKKMQSVFPLDAAQAPVTDANNTFSLTGLLREAELLCNFRSDKKVVVAKISDRESGVPSLTVDHLGTLAQQNYLTAVASQLQALAAPSKDGDIFSAFKSLFATFQVNVSAEPTVKDADRTKVRRSCEADVKEFEAAFFGQKIPEPPTPGGRATPTAAALPIGELALFGPMGALAGQVMGIIEPILVNFANLAQEFQKKQAVKAFLSDTGNQQKLRDAGATLGRTNSDFLFAKRLALAGAYAEQFAVATGSPLDLNSKAIQEACPRPFAAMYVRGDDGLPTAQFRRCYRAVWNHFEDGVAATLKAAAAYDALADAGDTSTQMIGYSAFTSDFQKIIDESTQFDFWGTASKMLAFAGAVETALSEDNLKKLQLSFEALIKKK